jgi:hypothetical protein
MWPSQHHFSITGFEGADALFVSALQRSQAPTTDQVRQAINSAVGAFGYPGCAGRVAQAITPRPQRPGCAGLARRWRAWRSVYAWPRSRRIARSDGCVGHEHLLSGTCAPMPQTLTLSPWGMGTPIP